MSKITIPGTGNATVTRSYNTCFTLQTPDDGTFHVYGNDKVMKVTHTIIDITFSKKNLMQSLHTKQIRTMNKLILLLVIILCGSAATHAQTSRKRIEKFATEGARQISLTGRKPTIDLLDSLANNAEVSIEMLSRMGDPDDHIQRQAYLKLIDDIVEYCRQPSGQRYVDVVRTGLKKAVDRSYEPDVQLHMLEQWGTCAKPADAAHIEQYLAVPELAAQASSILATIKEGYTAPTTTAQTPVATVRKPKPTAIPFWTEALDRSIDEMCHQPASLADSVIVMYGARQAVPKLLDMAHQCADPTTRDAILARCTKVIEHDTQLNDTERYLLLRAADELTPCDRIRNKIILELGRTHSILALSYLRHYSGKAAYADATAIATTEIVATHPEVNGGRAVSSMLYAAKQSFIRHYDEQNADTYIDMVLAAIDHCHDTGGYNMAHSEETRMEKRGFWVIHDEMKDFNMAFDWKADGDLTVSLRSMPVLVLNRQRGVKLAGDAGWHKFESDGDWCSADVSVSGSKVSVSVNGQKLISNATLVSDQPGQPANASGFMKFLADDNGATVRQYCMLKK